jgi:cytochrome bd-type quinol oxidase subunit 1
MNLPVIETPVFPRWVWMEEITFSHIPIATLITAFMLLAPAFEYLGVRRRDLRWERLSKSMIWFSLILFSPGAALGTGIPMFIIGTYPEFWSRWSNLFYWPLIVQFGFFLGEVFFLFFFYYLTWDRWAHRKGLHITMGVCAAFFGYMVQVVWDSLGSYMMTPGTVPLPQVDQPVAWSLRAMLNPSFLALLTHRTFGNFSYVLLLTGGVFALRYRGQKRKDPASENTAYFHWASGTCFLLGFLFFFPMPIIGWHYARVVQREAPAAFLALMGGHVSTYFVIKMSLILSFLAIGGTFVVQRYGSKALVGAITVGLLLVLAIVHIHPPLAWLGGSPLAWRLVATAVLLGLIGWLWLRRSAGDTQRKGWQWAMFIAGMAAFFTFLLGGFVRERSRNPDTVYGQIVKPEVKDQEADRYLVYTKWLKPHGLFPQDLERRAPDDWGAQVQQARQQGLELTEQEAERIVRYLEEHHR